LEEFLVDLTGFLTILFVGNLLIVALISPISGKVKGHAVSSYLERMTKGWHSVKFLLWVACEEVIFRWLFIGVIAEALNATSGVPFYAIVILSTVSFGLAHALNFPEGLPSPLLLLPQVFSGLVFMVVFLQWGLLGSTFVHFCFNATMFCTYKEQEFNWVDVGMIVWKGIVVGVSFVFIGDQIKPFLSWMRTDMSTPIPGWGMWQYLAMLLFVSSLIGLVLST
jgi:hypothetical protein